MPRRKRQSRARILDPKLLGSYTLAVLGALGSFAASHQGTTREVKRVEAEAGDMRYVMRQRVDSLIGVVNLHGRHIARLERRLHQRDRLDPIQLEYLGPPAPVRRGIFSRMVGFLKAPAAGR
jgi:hypothetical protein